jgi:anti-sigma factor RsiW
MTGPNDSDIPDDGNLVAYLDGALDPDARALISDALRRSPALRQRLTQLESGDRPFRQAFDALLDEAPRDRLEAMLARMDQRTETHIATSPLHRPFARLAAAVILIAVFVAGLSGGYIAATTFGAVESETNWREAVLNYVQLYDRPTIEAIPSSAAVQAQDLAKASRALGLDLSAEKVAAPGASLKLARVLHYEGRPVAQLIYLPPRGEPIALCVIKNGKPGYDVEAEERDAISLVHWASRGYEFVVIGKTTKRKLIDLAMGVKNRLL